MNARRSLRTYLLLLGLCLPLGVALLTLDLGPAAGSATPAGVEDAARARGLAKRVWRTLRRGGHTITLSVSEQELNSIAAFVDRGTGRLAARAKVDPGHADGAVSLRLLQRPLAIYLNLRFRLESSRGGIEITRLRLGRIPLPGFLVLGLAKLGIDTALGSGAGADVLQCVRSVEVGGGAVTVTLCPLQQMGAGGIGLRERLEQLRDRTEPFGDATLVGLYLQRLADLEAQLPAAGPVSLARVVGPLFAAARDRGGDPAAENRAAILALASVFGSRRFEHLIGAARARGSPGPRSGPVTLAGREDLRLHFVISAGLKLVSSSLATQTIGEFKELLDAHRGGSGFSFADLAADRAGVRFAETATESAGSASRLQEVLSRGAGERLFFPDIAGLPEGLSQPRFEGLFHTVESPAYRELVAAIDECIAGLPVHGATATAAASGPAAGCRVADVLPHGLR